MIIFSDGNIDLNESDNLIDLNTLDILYNSSKDNSKAHQIIDNLYLGDAVDAYNYSWLGNKNIELVITLDSELKTMKKAIKKHPHIKRHGIYMINDGKHSLDPIFNSVVPLIDECRSNNQSVLIHCRMGRSRSASIVILYLLYLFEWRISPDKVIKYVKKRRSIINPHPGFIDQINQIYYRHQN